ncbi:hypothetical protein JCM5353_008154 [Sporobolomyces roseus]
MESHDLLVHASLKDTLDLVGNIKDKWGTADPNYMEKGVLSRWVTSARACVTEYVLLLDVTEEQPLKSVLRNYRFTLLAADPDDPGLRQTRALPRNAYERITLYLEAVLSECGSVPGKKYQHPSDLPFFDRSYHSVLGAEHRKSYRSPSLAFLAIDYHLDLIGGQLFRLGKKDILKFAQTVVKPCSQATALAYWCVHGGWQQLRYKLSTSLEPAWSLQNEKYDEQLAIFQDLECFFRVVQAGIVSTPSELERYIVMSLELAPRILTVDQLMSRPEEPNNHGLHFFSPTESLLIKKGFFGSGSSAPHISHAHAGGESSTGTSQSLARSSNNNFFPQARLFSRLF